MVNSDLVGFSVILEAVDGIVVGRGVIYRDKEARGFQFCALQDAAGEGLEDGGGPSQSDDPRRRSLQTMG